MFKLPICIRGGALAAAVLLAGPGCGGGDPSTLPYDGTAAGPLDPAHSGALSVRLVPDGLPAPLAQLNLALSALELRVAGGWRPVPLALPGAAVDILGATPEAPLLLASRVPWPAGLVDAMRFTLGAGGSVRLEADDSEHSLAAPGRLLAGMGPPGSIGVGPGTETDLWITFSVAHVASPDPGDPDTYRFVPGPVRGYDRAATGSISGAVTGAAPGDPLAGVAVTAQLQRVAGEAEAIAFRTARTDAQGHFRLDLLPKGFTWCVVSQPAPPAHAAQASPAFAMGNAPFDTYQTSLACAPVPSPGTVSGTLAAASVPGRRAVVDLVQEIPAAGVPFRYVLRSALVEEDADGLRSFSIPLVPPGIYTAVLNDYHLDPDLGLLDESRSTARFVLSAGGKVVLTF